MSINYPTSLDSLTNPTGTDTTTAVDHASQHSNANDAIEALEAKVGVNSSAVTTSLDYKVSNASSVNPGHHHTDDSIDSLAATKLTGNLNIARFNSGTNASDTTYWRGDGTWVTPPGGGGGGTPGGSTGEVQYNNAGSFGGITGATTNGTILTLSSPAITTPTGIVKGDVGLGNVDNTSDATKNSATATLTNKRVTPRTGTTTSSATPTINTDNIDFYSITAQSGNITSMTTNLSGTPTEGQTLWLAMTATSGTPTITWGSSFEASSLALPTGLTTTRQDFRFVWNTTTSKWRFIGFA